MKLNCKIFSLTLMLAAHCAAAAGLDLTRPEPEANRNLIWIGHRSPDADSVACAIAAARLHGGKAVTAGAVNQETALLLELCGIPKPEEAAGFDGARVGLVDHNGALQLDSRIDQLKIVALIDHHPFQADSIRPPAVIAVDCRPAGACASIVADQYFRSGQAMEPAIARLLLGGILSDTRVLGSKSAVSLDREMAEKLAKVAGVADIDAFGMRLLEAKSATGLLTAREVVLGDYKEYVIAGRKIGFGVAETLYADTLLSRRDELRGAMAEIKAERKLDLLFFAIKDLAADRALLLIDAPEELAIAGRAYAGEMERRDADWLTLRKTSRKGYLIPRLTMELEK